MAFLFSWTSGYKELVNAIIRPPRKAYTIEDLGPKNVILPGGLRVKREDIELTNSRNLKLKCSWFRPRSMLGAKPVVIYLHGNSSSRMEAVDQLENLISFGITLFCFDFSGCGLSEGEYISLGYFECDDVKLVVDYLR